jgi:hypothetical protein
MPSPQPTQTERQENHSQNDFIRTQLTRPIKAPSAFIGGKIVTASISKLHHLVSDVGFPEADVASFRAGEAPISLNAELLKNTQY